MAADRTRHAAHVIESTHRAARWVQDMTDIDTVSDALAALEVVAGSIVRRVTAAEAADFIAQLPSELHEPLLDLRAGPDTNITLASVERDLAERLHIEPERAARLLPGVGLALRQLIGPGERRDVLAQLPKELQVLLPESEIPHPTP